jgi:hypothetical protein
VATWSEFELGAPAIAAVATGLWPGITSLQRAELVASDSECFSIAYLATTRRDGSPRLHPFCPILAVGRLFAAIPRSSPKGWDLRRDPRCVIHALPGADDDELCIRARAIEVASAQTRADVSEVVAASGVGGMIESVRAEPLFELALDQVDVAQWIDIGQPGTRAVRDRWIAS